MDSEKLAELVADACDDRKATDIRLIRVNEVSSLADWMVSAGGQSDVQVRAIARAVEDRLETEADLLPLRLDYGDVIVHVLMPDERGYYDLEAFWSHGESRTFLPSVK